jgi:hypothetical protein
VRKEAAHFRAARKERERERERERQERYNLLFKDLAQQTMEFPLSS